MQIMCNVNLRLTVVLANPLYHDSFRLSRKRLFALQFQYHRYCSWLAILLVVIVQGCCILVLWYTFSIHPFSVSFQVITHYVRMDYLFKYKSYFRMTIVSTQTL